MSLTDKMIEQKKAREAKEEKKKAFLDELEALCLKHDTYLWANCYSEVEVTHKDPSFGDFAADQAESFKELRIG